MLITHPSLTKQKTHTCTHTHTHTHTHTSLSPKDRAVQDVSDGAIWALPHLQGGQQLGKLDFS